MATGTHYRARRRRLGSRDSETSVPEPETDANWMEVHGDDTIEAFDIDVCVDEEFALNVMLELAEQLKFSKEQLDQFARYWRRTSRRDVRNRLPA